MCEVVNIRSHIQLQYLNNYPSIVRSRLEPCESMLVCNLHSLENSPNLCIHHIAKLQPMDSPNLCIL
ncbi:hypothetical protein AAZX31_08G333200 [Glycine max]